MKKTIAFLFIIALLNSCSEYQKALKSEDISLKYEIASKKYDQKKYSKAIRLFEQISATYRGKPQAEKMFYMFAQSYYKTEQYYLAGYQLESFVSMYPKSEKVQEAAFLAAKSYYILSPVYELDQTETIKAIEKLQSFIDNYPNSEYLVESNKMVKDLTDKIEKKSYENAKGYNTIMDYKSAIVAFDIFLNEFPGSSFKEDALYYKFDSAYKLAINSVSSKIEERLNSAKIAYQVLVKFNANNKYKKIANEKITDIETRLKNLIK